MKLSIITVVYNSVETVERTIKSVLKEKKKFDIEYIVIDGQSNDGTLQILKKYATYIDILVSEKDNGIYDAFNKGVNLSTGDYIFILAADDYLLKNSIQYFMNSINGEPDVWSGAIIYHKNHNYYYNKSDVNLEKLKTFCSLRHPASFFKRASFHKYGLYDVNYKIAGDRDLFLRFYVNGAKFQIEKYPIVCFSLGGISNTKLKDTAYEDYNISIKNGMSTELAKKIYIRKYLLKYIIKRFIRNFLRNLFSLFKLYRKNKKDLNQDQIVDNDDILKLGLE